MRAPHARVPFAVLLLTVFLQAAFGMLLTCHVVESADARANGIERVAAAALPGGASCPDCVPVESGAPGVTDAAAGPGATDAAAPGATDTTIGPGPTDTAAGPGPSDTASGPDAADTAAGPSATAAAGQGATDAVDGPDGSSPGPCDPDRHGGTTYVHAATGSGTRAAGTAGQTASLVRASPVVKPASSPLPAPAHAAGPVSPLALRGPAAVLCVDRN